jgi:hypothetical protein
VCEADFNRFPNIWQLDAAVLYTATRIANQRRFLGTANGAIELWQGVKQELLPAVETDEGNKLVGPTA